MALLQPKPYVHPNKRKRQDAETNTPTPLSDDKSKTVIKKKEEDCSNTRQIGNLEAAPTKVISEEKKVTIRLQVRLPQKGQVPLYDQMIASELAPKQAVLGMLTKGLRTLADDHTLIDEFQNYETRSESVETRRTIDARLVSILKSKFDPFDILSERAFGQKIGEALLILAGLENRHE